MKKTPGSVAHTDIMTSSIGGLIHQMMGFLTREHFFHTHIFVDYKSDLTFAYHAKTTNVDEALEAKQAYEREVYKYAKEVKHYHADNGTYACKGYKTAVHNNKQTLSYCGVGAHFQNGKAKNRIKLVSSAARTVLINGMYK